MQVIVDLNTIVAMAVVDTVVQMGFPSIYIKLSEDPHEFLEQLRVYTDEYSNDFSEILKQKIKVRASECVYTDLHKQGVSLVFKNNNCEVFFKIPEHLKLQQF